MIDEKGAQRWLDGYSRAWQSYDPKLIGELFSADAEYRWHPWDEGKSVARGRKAIVDAWLSRPDTPGTYTGEYRPLLVHGETVVAVGVSRYFTDSTRTRLDHEYHNLWLIEFDDAGRCRSFTEWYMKTPKPRRRS